MAKKDIDWSNIGFGYIKTDYRYVSNFKDGSWDEGTLTTDDMITLNECACVFQYAQTVFEGMKAYTTEDGKIVGAILCGHDGRRGCLYHVCVDEAYRRRGIGKAMVVQSMEALKEEGISNVSLIAFTQNDIGNAFWNTIGWNERQDLNYYDFVLNTENITAFNAQ